MRVTLTDNPADLGGRPLFSHQDCDCDCQCACPIDGRPPRVLSWPVAYYVELTPTCNNRCPGCGNIYAGDRDAQRHALDGDAWRALLTRLASHAHQFKLTGGEPTLHPAFAEIIHAIDELAVPFTLFTNGRWPRPAALTQRLRDTPTCDGLLISLHGPDPATHEAFSRVTGSFHETVQNIRRAADATLDVALSLVINRHNWDRVEETLDLALRLGANHLVCNRYIGAPRADLTPGPDQLRAAMATIRSLRSAGRPIRFGNCIPLCFENSSARGCAAGSTFATIDPWGRMRPCNHAPLIAGDLKTQAVEEVWQGTTMDNWRAAIPSGCETCPAFATCHGGCRAQALLTGHTRDPLIRTAPVELAPPAEIGLFLYAGLRPVGRFARRREGETELLIHKGQVVTVPAAFEPLLARLDGSLTLRQIERQYGAATVDWVGTLYQNELVTGRLNAPQDPRTT